MATEEAKSLDEIELCTLREEYVKLQDHLAMIELKYQSVLNTSSQENQLSDQFMSKLKTLVTDLFNNQMYSDIVISLQGGDQLFAHKLILSARSLYWGVDNLMDVDKLDLTDINYDVTYVVIRWVYTDDINTMVDVDFLQEILQLASRFHLEPLVTRCQKALISRLNLGNWQKIYDLSLKLSCQLLKDYCLEYLSQQQADKKYTKTKSRATQFDSSAQSDLALDGENIPKSDTDSTSELSLLKTDDIKINNLKVSYVCKTCGKTFMHRNSHRRHEQTHEGLKPHTCEVCGKSFTEKGSVKKHFQRMHTDKGVDSKPPSKPRPIPTKKLHCDFCDKTFPRKFLLEQHRTLHTGEKPHKCMKCDRTFRHSESLRVHIKTHTGEKPYQCDTCGRFFAEKCHLKQHSRVHTGVKPFICKICNRPFRHRESLVVHARLHSDERPYQCDLCGKSFRTSGGLNIHVRVHTDARPCKCSTCDKSFRDTSHLRRHERIHLKKKQSESSNPVPGEIIEANDSKVNIESAVETNASSKQQSLMTTDISALTSMAQSYITESQTIIANNSYISQTVMSQPQTIISSNQIIDQNGMTELQAIAVGDSIVLQNVKMDSMDGSSLNSQQVIDSTAIINANVIYEGQPVIENDAVIGTNNTVEPQTIIGQTAIIQTGSNGTFEIIDFTTNS